MPINEPYTNKVDLRILALTDAKVLPQGVQDEFDHWRIWRTRDAVVSAVRKRLASSKKQVGLALHLYLERLEYADKEQTIFEGIYALAEAVDLYRRELAIHSGSVVMIMASGLNPWGLMALNPDFAHPPTSVVNAAEELWRLARLHNVDIEALLTKLKDDETLMKLQLFYDAHYEETRPFSPKPDALPEEDVITKLINDQATLPHKPIAKAWESDPDQTKPRAI